jgi:hypothetical protein
VPAAAPHSAGCSLPGPAGPTQHLPALPAQAASAGHDACSSSSSTKCHKTWRVEGFSWELPRSTAAGTFTDPSFASLLSLQDHCLTTIWMPDTHRYTINRD